MEDLTVKCGIGNKYYINHKAFDFLSYKKVWDKMKLEQYCGITVCAVPLGVSAEDKNNTPGAFRLLPRGQKRTDRKETQLQNNRRISWETKNHKMTVRQ